MTINSKQKGNRFERFVAHLFKLAGYENARRSQQYAGINNDADVVGVPYIHIEAKHVERLNIYEAMKQSILDARPKELPIVIHKKNQKSVLVTMEFKDWIVMYKEFEKNVRESDNDDIYFGSGDRNNPYNCAIVFGGKESGKEK